MNVRGKGAVSGIVTDAKRRKVAVPIDPKK
jgi:hypothetical protein